MSTVRAIFEQTPDSTHHVILANSRTGLGRVGGQYRIDRAVAVTRSGNAPQY